MKAEKIALYGLCTALALVLSYVEALIPLSFSVPGVKLGLANIAVIFALYRMSFRDACVISGLRVLLVSVLFGNVFSLAYSFAGAVLSLLTMALLKRTGAFSVTGVSVAGGVAHNVGQIAVAIAVLETGRLVYYLPVLCVSGLAAGVCIGLISALMIKRVVIEKK